MGFFSSLPTLFSKYFLIHRIYLSNEKVLMFLKISTRLCFLDNKCHSHHYSYKFWAQKSRYRKPSKILYPHMLNFRHLISFTTNINNVTAWIPSLILKTSVSFQISGPWKTKIGIWDSVLDL